MKVTKKNAINLFKELGFATASKWPAGKLETKLKSLPEKMEGATLSGKVLTRANKICKALSAGHAVKVIDGDPEADKKLEKQIKDSKKKGATKKKKAAGSKGVGVQATIVAMLLKGPVSKDTIHKALVKKFPDRNADSMKNTINSQVPSGLRIEKGITVHKNEKGKYFIKESEMPKPKTKK